MGIEHNIGLVQTVSLFYLLYGGRDIIETYSIAYTFLPMTLPMPQPFRVHRYLVLGFTPQGLITSIVLVSSVIFMCYRRGGDPI